MQDRYLLSALTPLALPIRLKQAKPRDRSFKHFLALPGEIRNQIYNLLIFSSLNTPKSTLKKARPSDLPASTKFSITALPRWNGSPQIRLEGVGCLQILFISKQIHREVSSLLYSRADNLTLGGYMLQYRDEDPSRRWKATYDMLERRLGLLSTVRNVTIRMPSASEELLKGYWRSLGILTAPREKAIPINLGAGIPGMIVFLRKFESLLKIRLVVTVEDREPPDFESMLEFWGIYGRRLGVEFVVPDWGRRTDWHRLQTWNDAWQVCLMMRMELDYGRLG
jgi:hypothetical protein